MIIGIKATQIGPGGGLTHLTECVRWFGELAPDDRIIVYGHTGQRELFPLPPRNVVYRLFQLPSRGLVGRLFWERTQLPKLLSLDKCDILLELGNYATPNSPCPTVTLVHNIAPFVPEYVLTESLYQRLRLTCLKRLTLSALERAAGTIFLSKYEQECLRPLVKSPERLNTVIYHGAPDWSQAGTDATAVGLSDTNGCILCVSHIYRYKGILELVKAYDLAIRRDATLPNLDYRRRTL